MHDHPDRDSNDIFKVNKLMVKFRNSFNFTPTISRVSIFQLHCGLINQWNQIGLKSSDLLGVTTVTIDSNLNPEITG